jgi:hypothetical protein
MIVAIGTHHDEEGNHKHFSIEWRNQVSIPVQTYASDENDRREASVLLFIYFLFLAISVGGYHP